MINGALRPMTAELGLSPLTEGVVTSSLLFGAAVGAFLGGRLSDAPGRRRTILGLAAVVFVRTTLPETRGRTLEAIEEDVTTGEIYAIAPEPR